ncbi:MAG: hypothetical protein ACRDLL_17505, partial [Solirubrobacterales bacterium]
RQADIARAAQDGSKAQIDALARVAAAQKQLQNQGQGAVQTGLDIFLQQQRDFGITDPGSVNKRQLDAALQRRQRENEKTAATFQAGGSVDPTKLGNALQGQNLKDQFAGFSGIGDAAKAAFTSVEEAFKGSIGDRLTGALEKFSKNTADTFIVLGDQIGTVFENMEGNIEGSFDRILERVKSGTSGIVQSLADQIEEIITRRLEAAVRAG